MSTHKGDWTEEDNNQFRKIYGIFSIDDVCRMLRRGRPAVEKQRVFLNMEKACAPKHQKSRVVTNLDGGCVVDTSREKALELLAQLPMMGLMRHA